MTMKTIESGDEAPIGFHKRVNQPFIYLKLPLFPWYGRVYQVMDDSHVTGWHLKCVFVRLVCGDVVLSEVSRESHWLGQ